jgi:DNA-binding IscR family transcriptional regulator
MHACLEGLVEAKALAIFTSLYENPKKLYHIKSLAKSANVSVTSTGRIVKNLAKKGFVEVIKVGKISLYKLAEIKRGLEELVEDKKRKIFITLKKNPGKIFHINSLAKSANVPETSTARIIKSLVRKKFAQDVKVGKISVYRLASSEKVSKLEKVL